MDQNLLVEVGIEDGQLLIRQLNRERFEVEVAFWVKRDEADLWHLNIASSSFDPKRVGDALKIVYGALDKIPQCSVTPLEISLLTNQDPIARDAAALRDRFPSNEPKCFRGRRLGKMETAEVCVYPRRFPMKVQELPDGQWQVLISEPDEMWLTCDSKDDAEAIAAAPVLEYEGLAQLGPEEKFTGELQRTLNVLAKYHMDFGFLRAMQEARK
jgi:hypothetical protein